MKVSRSAPDAAHLLPPTTTSSSGVVAVARVKMRLTGRNAERDALLRFLSAEQPTEAHRLADLCRGLVDSGVLECADTRGRSLCIEQAECGGFELPLREDAALATRHLRVVAERAVEMAKVRLLQALRGLLRTPRDDRFVHEAMYLGRIEQVRATHASAARWRPTLREGEQLSDWLLAVLAIDVWENGTLYRSGLSVCNACDVVTLDLGHHHPTRCTRHADVSDDDLFDPRELPTRPEFDRGLAR